MSIDFIQHIYILIDVILRNYVGIYKRHPSGIRNQSVNIKGIFFFQLLFNNALLIKRKFKVKIQDIFDAMSIVLAD